MSPMIDIQRRHQTIFRVRFGEKQGNRPSKLTDAIRVTSPNPDVVDAFIAVYGGKRKPWEGTQWEAKLPTTSLNILVLPGQSISQWWEKYRGSVCDRRCDGVTETKSGKPCMCSPDVEVRTAARDECAPTTRVSVICPDVAVVGSGMFICHGLVGAETLPQSIAVAEAALSRGLMVPAVLRVVEFRGRNHFIVPQIEVVGVSFNALAAAAENGQLQHVTRGELEQPAAVDVPFTPVRTEQLAAPPTPSTREQLAAVPQPSKPRSNAQVPIPATGVVPRGAGSSPTGLGVSGGGNADGPESAPSGENAPGPSATPNIGGEGVEAEVRAGEGVVVAPPAAPSPSAPLEDAARIAIWCAEVGIMDDLRPAFLHACVGVTSAHDVPPESLGALRETLDEIRAGRLELIVDADGENNPWLREKDATDEAPPVGPAPAEVTWRALLGQVRGIGQKKLLDQARLLAGERGIGLPCSIDEIPAALNGELRSWLDEQNAAKANA